MKALFVGLGSVGQRHLVNFKEIVGNDAEVFAYRSTNHNILIKDGTGIPCESLAEHYKLKEFYDIHEALSVSPDVVFITNPSSKHLEIALVAVQHDCHLFIEKPLSDTLAGLDSLVKESEKRNSVVMMGYQSRFHPCYKMVRDILSEEIHGGVLSAGFEWGTYLPVHHPYENYQHGYAALKSLGGGVVLGLSHEIDIICSLWGQPEKVYAVGGKLSSLEMDAEDTVSVLMAFRKDNQKFPVTLSLSYAQTREVRKFKVQLDGATLFCDLSSNSVMLFDCLGKVVAEKSFPEHTRNDLFLEEMNEFLQSVRERRRPVVSLRDGVESLRLALKIKEMMYE
ncbi:MAG: Gfo/Idh/MocA family oxidoreductase [Candidatus Brocadiaceae bacterium]|nr:Gfo/Idh/MocA family oxidoreductase [Candidatus Brocadiaceae bacterium]